MPSLLDMGPLTEDITVRGSDLTLAGVGLDGMFYLIANFPDLKKIMDGKIKELTPAKLMKGAPQTIASVIAVAATDRDAFEDDDAWEAAVAKGTKIVRKWGAGDQLTALNVIFRLTFTEGVGPFVQQMNKITAMFVGAGKGPDTNSSARISASLVMDIPPLERGAIHRAH